MKIKKCGFIALALIVSLTLCLSLTGYGSKTVEKLQNESGALLEGGSFEEGAVLNYDKIDTTSENADEVFEKLGDRGVTITDEARAYIYDISVTKDGKEVQPNGKVKVTVPMPQDGDETDYTVYHIKDSGDIVRLSAVYADGMLTFETDGFSYYVFVATSNVLDNMNYTDYNDTRNANGTVAFEDEQESVDADTANAAEGEAAESSEMAQNETENVALETDAAVPSEPDNTALQTDTTVSNVPDNTASETTTTTPTVPESSSSSSSGRVTLTATASEGGTITDGYADGKKVAQNASETLTATASNGYHFVGWFVGDNKVSENTSYTFTVIENTTLIAKFERDQAAQPSDGSMTEDEWDAAISYWKEQTNVKVVEHISSPHDADLGAQIMLYQFDGTAYSQDGYFEDAQASKDYKGRLSIM